MLDKALSDKPAKWQVREPVSTRYRGQWKLLCYISKAQRRSKRWRNNRAFKLQCNKTPNSWKRKKKTLSVEKEKKRNWITDKLRLSVKRTREYEINATETLTPLVPHLSKKLCKLPNQLSGHWMLSRRWTLGTDDKNKGTLRNLLLLFVLCGFNKTIL